ncbi:PREDICTED: histone-lysine N-methyltransferase, H3 lysine-9 specific SUVH1 [Tarenaya hassleriana]|uniref:histone-lysine N-methyltransferase, H3 lysine-9 specific SUVH1 n=1 Tax=Tarenaya hassleriana TaxID=28532 RepID=UPI00053C2AC3|nr:PREDICTED: histone-lysine N-methyltransferase, H3 lysine-9 specific SUVH1 [Tarenaya hassleriana]XP_010543638.1 PREDICTED: histone-lysine N-methyltransferase, H3 lysine-9 specific SUVH1 [Tarenaya hassleriana]XP_010543639.1 PREDICTED: histone-lysine N-methyltransferase, H3 lysine-9 specific SUVH1 [Tarenaya hassleriana]XP_010543640.1 PREDICTED: histone-lysine N-methyltransferase, H3 lysine-9 specific SUVH1 [Tarenaya hassleriana]XP_019058395.1 PREDICTED: histone-lysine N-methyltransferase, H3 ly
MEGFSGNQHDKTRVFDVKPLRSLMPIFPDAKQGPPFVCAPPFGPFPSGFSPFYPFSSPQAQPQEQAQPQAQSREQAQPQAQTQEQAHAYQHTPDLNQSQRGQASFVTPLRTFRTDDLPNGHSEHEESNSLKRKSRKTKKTPTQFGSGEGAAVSGGGFVSGISVPDRENGNRELVINVLLRFDALRRRFAQLEDAKEAVSGVIKRADLKAGSSCMSKGVRTNMTKRLGIVPGVEIGDIFFFRFEMCLVGLHSPSMAGIDYMVIKDDADEDPVATSIVSSGYYDNDEANSDILIYSGHGGNADRDKQASDQKLERGNLALERSLRRFSPVRVIRGFKDASKNGSPKIYIYDGLYEIKESWVEKGKSGHNTFKYKLVRIPGQPPAFAVWKSVQKWKEGFPSREGLILPDLTSGAESIPVSLVNDIDTEKGPAYFTYSPTVKYSEQFRLVHPSSGCDCHPACKPGNLNCSCIRKNDGDFPYTGNGILVSRKPVIYECSPACPCMNCKNRVTQMGLKVRLEVFKTANKGWGLRSWDPIRAGSFICIYAGEAKNKSMLQGAVADDDYTFDTTRAYTPFKWNYEPGLAEEDNSEEISEDFYIPAPLVISAKNVGNVARFMNHSCSPNVFWQPVMYEHNNQSFFHVAFFALSHIPPMTELTYDYGVSRPSGTEAGAPLYGKKKCLCGSEYCRGSFG